MQEISKQKQEKIRELAHQDYLKKEVAEKLEVSLETVRKYWPPNMGSFFPSGEASDKKRRNYTK